MIILTLYPYTSSVTNKKIFVKKTLRSIQDAMRSDNPAGSKFKRVSTDFPNLAVLTKSATPGEIQATDSHRCVGNKSLGETVATFNLEGYLKVPTMVSINIDRAFAGDGEKIRLPTTEVLLRAAPNDLAKTKKFL